MKIVNVLAWIFVAAGGINLGLIGGFDYDLIWVLTGYTVAITRTIYAIVGIATLYLLLMMLRRKSPVSVN